MTFDELGYIRCRIYSQLL